jgi:hypothetical protein
MRNRGKFSANMHEGMCGFTVNAFLQFNGTLLVASDLGLSVREQNKGATDIITWHHFVPDLKNPTLMRETTCHKLYGQLLRTVDRKEDCCGWSSFGQLKDALKNRDPVFLKKWEKHK